MTIDRVQTPDESCRQLGAAAAADGNEGSEQGGGVEYRQWCRAPAKLNEHDIWTRELLNCNLDLCFKTYGDWKMLSQARLGLGCRFASTPDLLVQQLRLDRHFSLDLELGLG
ncbi:hypothetical protein ACLOJK_012352 [Asimina triloba]